MSRLGVKGRKDWLARGERRRNNLRWSKGMLSVIVKRENGRRLNKIEAAAARAVNCRIMVK